VLSVRGHARCVRARDRRVAVEPGTRRLRLRVALVDVAAADGSPGHRNALASLENIARERAARMNRPSV
jgi:hypothetical protein